MKGKMAKKAKEDLNYKKNTKNKVNKQLIL